MKAIRAKLVLVAISALVGLLLIRVASQLGDTVTGIRDRHPGMGFGGWLMVGIWFAGGVVLGVECERRWGEKRLFLKDDVSTAAVLLYLSISAVIYLFIFYP